MHIFSIRKLLDSVRLLHRNSASSQVKPRLKPDKKNRQPETDTPQTATGPNLKLKKINLCFNKIKEKLSTNVPLILI